MRGARARLVWASCVGIVVWCWLAVGVALGERGHVFSGKFGVHGSGVGELSEPAGVAVNETSGVVYVADKAAGRVEFYTGKIGETVPLGEFDGSGSLGEGAAAGAGGLPEEEVTGKFLEPDDVAVDNSCREHRPVLTGAECAAFDPSDGDVYVVDVGHRVVDKYSATGAYLAQVTWKTLGLPEAFELPAVRAVAVTSTGELLVSLLPQSALTAFNGVFRLSDAVVNLKLEFVPTGHAGALWGLGARPQGGFVIANGRGIEPVVLVFGAGGGLLNEGLSDAFLSGLAVESCTGDVYLDENGQNELDRGEGVFVGRFTAAGDVVPDKALLVPEGRGTHVAVDCATGTLFVGNDGAGAVDVFGPEPPGPPTVEEGSTAVFEVSSDSAEVAASINPRSEPGEAATTYELEYGSCPVEGACDAAPYPKSVSGSLAASYDVTRVNVPLDGLTPETRYHFRVLARNTFNQEPALAVFGEEVLFTTEPTTTVGRLDGRGWELVSPVDKRGASLVGIGEEGVIQSSVDGSAFTYLATATTEAGAPGSANQVQVFARRAQSGDWGSCAGGECSCDVNLPHEGATGAPVGSGQEYAAFSQGLGLGLVRPAGPFVASVAPGASEDTPLLGDLSGSCASGRSYQPLVDAGNVPTGTHFGEESEECARGLFCGPQVLAANSELSAVVLSSSASLVEGVPPGGVYEWFGGNLLAVSVLPSGEPVGLFDGTVPVSAVAGSQGGAGSLRSAVSADGSRVVWSEKETGRLFVWDRDLGRSIRVDKVQDGTGAGHEAALFQYMTPDGGRVFFTDTQRLKADSGGAGTPDLYECEVVVEGSEGHCVLSDLTPAAGSESANVLGLVLGGAESGSPVYFVANGKLAGEPAASGEQPVKGDCGEVARPPSLQVCNLFMWDEGRVMLVAVLSGQDAGDWGGSATASTLQKLTGASSADGNWLVFMSDRSLTKFDNRDAMSGQPDEEVFEYRAGTNLVCVSCDPSGARPVGSEYAKLSGGVAGGDRVWPSDEWVAGSIPGWTPFRREAAMYQSRYLGRSGRLFFDSTDRLLPGDGNGVEDVYEFEPVGVGSCNGLGSPGFVAADGGCLGLVSGGEGSEDSGFLDASASGDDVFFLTASRLLGRDKDTAYDVYDARVGGGEVGAPVTSGCSGVSCQVPAAPPEAVIPGSMSFEGPASALIEPGPRKLPAPALTRPERLAKALKACRIKRVRRKRVACEQTARKRYGPVKIRKAAGKSSTGTHQGRDGQ
jgi:hypothetical protein